MKLSEITTEGSFKLLLIGAPGSGKTVLSASFPGPILYLDFDSKVDSAALYYKGNKELLEGVDVRDLSLRMGIDPIVELKQIIDKELIPQQVAGEMKYKTIVIDSISAFSTAALKHIIDTNPGIKGVMTAQGKMPDRPHYGVLLREFSKLIPGILSLKCNVIMCAHTDVYKSDDGTIIKSAMMDGSFDQKLPIFFKECWHTYVDDKGKHWAQTKASTQFSCLRSQIAGLPNPLPLSEAKTPYDEIKKYI